MKTNLSFSLKSAIIKALIFLIAFIGFLPIRSQSTTSFESMKKNNTPNYQVINRIVNSKEKRLAKYYGSNEWNFKNIGKAFAKSSSYFPKKFYYNSSKEYFMSHQFTAGGGKRMDVYQSEELKKAVKNTGIFNDKTIVNYYKSIKDDASEKSEFKTKMGLLDSYFESKKTKKLLKNRLGNSLFSQLLKTLREEGDHVFAAALLHEGMHALVGNSDKANKLDKDFKSCKTPVNWDELRGYTAEMQYHYNYYKHSQDKIKGHMKAITKLLKELEKLRGEEKPLKKSQIAKIEKLKARIKAHIAMIRVSLREILQSLHRVKSLLDFFKKQKYVKVNAPKEYHDMVKNMEDKAQKFADKAKKAVDAYEKGLKGLEDLLKAWNEWAACKKKIPPTEDDHKKNNKEIENVSWPSAPSTNKEKDIAEKNLAISYNIGPYAMKPSDDDYDEEVMIEDLSVGESNISENKGDIHIEVGIQNTSPKMDALESYHNYLNATWNGTIEEVGSSRGIYSSISYFISDGIEIALDFNSTESTINGMVQNASVAYESSSSMRSLGGLLTYVQPLSPNFDITLSGGVLIHFTEYSETEGTFNITEKTDAIGGIIKTGLQYKFSNSIGLHLSVGYQFAKIDDFSEATFFNATNDPVELDFSGMLVRIGFRIKL